MKITQSPVNTLFTATASMLVETFMSTPAKATVAPVTRGSCRTEESPRTGPHRIFERFNSAVKCSENRESKHSRLFSKLCYDSSTSYATRAKFGVYTHQMPENSANIYRQPVFIDIELLTITVTFDPIEGSFHHVSIVVGFISDLLEHHSFTAQI